MPLSLDIITQERVVYAADDLEMVVAPGIDGVLGILPRHTPVLTALREGELKILRAGEEEFFAVGGGFMEVRPDRVIVLAETAEVADEIDEARAEEARKRAEEMLKDKPPGVDVARLEGVLRRSRVRLQVARRRRRRRRRRGGRAGPGGG
ncbi:MAG: F0F1 ATP synthase subunit epsilon [Anaerolineae bacterium]